MTIYQLINSGGIVMTLINRKTLKAAKKAYVGAATYAKVEGGYLAFDTWAEYERWKNQK